MQRGFSFCFTDCDESGGCLVPALLTAWEMVVARLPYLVWAVLIVGVLVLGLGIPAAIVSAADLHVLMVAVVAVHLAALAWVVRCAFIPSATKEAEEEPLCDTTENGVSKHPPALQ